MDEKTIDWELDVTSYPSASWVKKRRTSKGQHIFDVVIVGGGQGALGLSFGLKREQVINTICLDENSKGKEGPWNRFARMPTLRTPKYITGPDNGVASLTIRAYYERRFSKEAWNELTFVPTDVWADYLEWFRDKNNISVKNSVKVKGITWNDKENVFNVPYFDSEKNDLCETIYAKKVVLATGIDGSGKWSVPKWASDKIDSKFYNHSTDMIDFKKFKGKKIGVLGAGAGAFDNTIRSLEEGASKVDLFFRRSTLVNINPYRWAEFVGFLRHHKDLPDEKRWKFIHKIIEMGQLPPKDTHDRACTFPAFKIHPGSSWIDVKEESGKIHVTTNKETFIFDYLIFGTGFRTKLELRPELLKLHTKICLWRDKYQPTEQTAFTEDLLEHPYLTRHFQYCEKNSGESPYLKSLFNFNFGCLLSNGFGGASISGMKYSVKAITEEITRQLYCEDADQFYSDLCEFNIKEF
ncbi:NAD(P)/FAD-dependent oxidoreductase [Bacteriovoracaceae bacterium]|nr:NAD(P)/FAD-dependent oxidoreductase [Bacteriovoracaceae bacterium]